MKLAVPAILGASAAAVSASTLTVMQVGAREVTITSSASLPSSTAIETPPTFTSHWLAPDPYQCATQNLSQYFDLPSPTGMLDDAMNTYFAELLKPCLATATGTDMLNCRVTDSSQLCGFTSYAAPTPALITAFASYESAAASFWRSNSESAASLSVECASAWNHMGPLSLFWLNQTITFASCVLKDLPPISSSSTTTGSSSSRSGSSTATGTGTTKTTPTSTATNAAALAGKRDIWILAGTGVIAGYANAFA
jgi:hypothetical protein